MLNKYVYTPFDREEWRRVKAQAKKSGRSVGQETRFLALEKLIELQSRESRKELAK